MTSLFAPSAEKYASRVVPAIVSPDLDDGTGLMIGSKGQAIVASQVATPQRAADIVAASVRLVRRVVSQAV
ncbi:hypothetical protein [Agromyces laixinhei]|uniref:hypothetical protein n=1 Tax=Agromyces laixinhei TaxID=2585717 RepID=UPI001117929A|nr:hypothetical protein [Agromyces laixinhei]